MAQNGSSDRPPHWGYDGETGQEYWGRLSPEFILCAEGNSQSPIDITHVQQANLPPIHFLYGQGKLHIFNNGFNVFVNVDAGNCIQHNGVTYELVQFHFHRPSEHTVNGKAAEMEVHFVHQDPLSGGLAVVGVMLLAGAHNPAYAPVFDHLPLVEDITLPLDVTVPLLQLLPEEKSYFAYDGSLTTPPCSESVRWLLLDTPLELAPAQIAAFAAIYPLNARKIQPRNGRDLLHGSGTG